MPKGDARKILEARLERFHEPFMEVEAVRQHVHEDTLFPLGRAWLEGQIGEAVEFKPREVLNWARDAWEDEQAKLAHLGGEEWIRKRSEPVAGPVLGEESRKLTQEELEKAIDATVDRKIEEQITQRRLEPGSLPPDAGNLAGLVESLLGQCCGGGLPYTFRGVERTKKKGASCRPTTCWSASAASPTGGR